MKDLLLSALGFIMAVVFGIVGMLIYAMPIALAILLVLWVLS